jgi:uncharacterized protein
MKVMISIQHPAWVHQFHHIIKRLQARGDEVRVLAIDKDGASLLLREYGIPYVLCAKSTGKNIVEKGWLFFRLCVNHTLHALRFKPDILIGRASPMMAIAAWITRRPHLIYEDTEVSKFSLRICKRLSTKILTPSTFLTDLGKAQQRVDTYKELFYLHPSVFTPSRATLENAGFNPNKPYVLVRFVAWNASHDVGKRGLSDSEKLELVQRLTAAGVRVWVSSEKPLCEELEPYRLKTPYSYVHHVLAFARLVYSEGATMASEAAVLGTHALYVNEIQSGSTREQSERFGLLYCYHDRDRYEKAAEKALELLVVPDLRKKGQMKQMRLLAEKHDINDLFIEEMDHLTVVNAD